MTGLLSRSFQAYHGSDALVNLRMSFIWASRRDLNNAAEGPNSAY